MEKVFQHMKNVNSCHAGRSSGQQEQLQRLEGVRLGKKRLAYRFIRNVRLAAGVGSGAASLRFAADVGSIFGSSVFGWLGTCVCILLIAE